MPYGGEGGSGYDEAGAEAEPEAYGSVVEAEGEKVADGESNDPVADDLDDEAGVGVAGSAEGSGGGDLEAVEELEERGYEEERDRCGDDVGVGREGSGDGVGEEEEDGREGGHTGCSEEYGGPSCGGGFLRGFAADGLAYADGGGGGDGEGHHEGEAGAVEGDLMAGERERAHGSDEEGDGGEDGDLNEDLGSGGGSEESEAGEAGALDVAEHGAEAVVVLALDSPDSCGDEEGEIGAGDGGGEARAGDSESGDMNWSPTVAVDEEPVADDIAEVRGDEGYGDGADVIESLQVAAEGEVKEENGCSPVECAEEGDGSGDDLMVDGKAEHEDGRDGDEAHEDCGEDGGEDEAVQEPAVGFVVAACSVGLGEVGVEREEDSGDAEAEGVVEDLSESRGGDGEGGVGHVSDHHGVHDAHRHPAEFGEDEREGKGEDGSDLLTDRHDCCSAPPSSLALKYCCQMTYRGNLLAKY